MTANEQINQAPPKMVAGFWIRVVADAIDMAILWAFAFILGFLFENWFLKLGGNGVWVGLLISLAYFVPMQSNIGNGQSFGKRLLGIQVLDMDGHPLSLAKSFLRYLVIAFVAYFGVFTGVVSLVMSSSLLEFVTSIMGTLWFIALVGCYLLVPLHPLKRGLHDLVAGSLVVYRGQFNANSLATLDNSAKTKKAFFIVGGITAVAVLVGIWGLMAIKKKSAIASMQEIQTKLEATGKFHAIGVADNTFSAKSVTTRSIIVQGHVDGPLNQSREDLKPLYDLAFQTVRDQLKDLSQYNNLRVGLRMGYDLGIRKRYVTLFQDENPKTPGERKDAGSNSNF